MREVDLTGHFSAVAWNRHGGPCSNCGYIQYGGCSSTLFRRAAHGAVEAGVDPLGLGRFAWTIIRGRQLPPGEDDREGNPPSSRFKDLVLVSAYRPNPPGEGSDTVWIQHREFLAANGREAEDPRDAFVKDLTDKITEWRTKGLEVIVGVDANEDLRPLHSSSFRFLMKEVGMFEAILDRHGSNAPKTYQRRTTEAPIDGIFVSPGVVVKLGGYLGFEENLCSDHRCLWIDIDLKTTLGGFSPSPRVSSPRQLTLRDGRAVQRYIRKAERDYLRLDIPGRLGRLLQAYHSQNCSFSSTQLRSFNFIHKQMYDVRRLAERSCRKLHMGGVPWSPETQELRDRIALWKMLRSIHTGKPVSSRKLRRLMRKTDLLESWKLSSAEVDAKLLEARKDYLRLKLLEARKDYLRLKDPVVARRLRASFLGCQRTIARHRRHRSLKALNRFERLKRMRQREQTRRRKKAQAKDATGGLKAIQVEQKMSDGSTRLVAITDPLLVEDACIQENQVRYDQTRSPFPTPPMQEPLYSLFTGPQAESNVLALVQGSLDLPSIDPATDVFLSQCRSSPRLPRLDMSVSVEDHIGFWSRMKEDKGSEPHGLHNGHFKAAIKSDLLAQCDTIIRNLPMSSGVIPDQWRHLMNFSIEKQPGELRVSKMRTIQMMNAEFQANNKKVGKAAMEYAESHSLIPPGQCGARKNHDSMALVISKRCNWDLLIQQRRAAGWISNDAKSCFDRIVHWVGMVALFRFGIPWPALSMMFITLQLAVHRIRTGFGDSDRPFFPPSDIPFQGCGQGNGAGPTIWVAVSAILIGMLECWK